MEIKKIILDTNFLLIPAQFGVDIFSEIERIADFPYELCVVEKSLEELDAICARGGKEKRAAKLAVDLIKRKHLKIIRHQPTERDKDTADDVILGLANKGEYVVATQDIALKRLLRAKKVNLIVLRQKKYLMLI